MSNKESTTQNATENVSNCDTINEKKDKFTTICENFENISSNMIENINTYSKIFTEQQSLIKKQQRCIKQLQKEYSIVKKQKKTKK